MTNETKPVLLTEAEWQRISAPLGLTSTIDQIANELRERGLIAPEPVDPLLIEAREVCAAYAGGTLGAESYRNGSQDEFRSVQACLAALRRGMELAKPELTREMVGEIVDAAMMKWKSGRTMLRDCLTDAFHAALTEGQSK